MKLSRVIPIVVIVILIGLIVSALIYIKGLRIEITQLNQTIISLNESIRKIETEKDNYADKFKDQRDAFHYPLTPSGFRRKKPEEMIREYEKALATNPQDPPIYYNLGLIYDEHLDQPEKAIEYYQKYLELIPADASDRDKVKLWIENCQKRLKESSGGELH